MIQIEDDGSIPVCHYRFYKIANIPKVGVAAYVDVIGVVVECGELSEFISNKTQKELKRITLTVMDETASIKVTLWNEAAIKCESMLNKLANMPIIAIKACKISDFNGMIHG